MSISRSGRLDGRRRGQRRRGLRGGWKKSKGKTGRRLLRSCPIDRRFELIRSAVRYGGASPKAPARISRLELPKQDSAMASNDNTKKGGKGKLL